MDGVEGLELSRLELVDLLAGERAEVLDMVQQLPPGEVERELLRLTDHLGGVSGLLDRDADQRRIA